MKFFKYLIFIFLSFFSSSVFALTIKGDPFNEGQVSSSSLSGYCGIALQRLKASYTGGTYNGQQITLTSSSINGTKALCKFGPLGWEAYGEVTQTQCEPGTKRFLDGYITSPTGTPPDDVCFAGCIHKSDGGGTAFDTPNGNLIWGFNAETTGVTCDADTPKGDDIPTPVDPNMKPEECKNSNGSDSYCNKPADKNCPTGYKEASFNNKQICVKNSTDPDPTKPNPNDPNNGDGDGNCNGTNNCNTTEFDDSKIIAAINASTSAISSAIASLSNTITNGLNSLASSINSVTSSINANTSAVNSNGDKVTNAVNSGTNATKENGKKLDGIKDEISKGNGFLKDIKDWLFGDVPEDPNHEIPTSKLNEKSFLTNLIVVNASYCPQDKVINWSTPVGTLNKTVSFQDFCDATSWFGYLVLAASYYLGAMIVIRDS